MLLRTRSDDRPYHWGPYPLEVLPRDIALAAAEVARAPLAAAQPLPKPNGPLGRAAQSYLELFAEQAAGEVAPAKAPVLDDLPRRAADLNSPLKKASLTGFHATAKHIAAKAVSPSSETMRTI